jgi:uncharacterized phage protein (TIGR01671 family)
MKYNSRFLFRIWSLQRKRWESLVNFSLDFLPRYEQNDIIIQQCTGLMDENNVEIYEGDIIKDNWKENHPYGYCPDEWYNKEDIFVVRYEPPSFIFPQRRGEQRCIEDFKRFVIGNIFENPELLKI